jgi:multidrug transporter EmrE-like cation transporter
MSTLFRYILRGQYPVFGIFYVYLIETLLFLIFGLWLLRRSEHARVATIGLCLFAIVWSSYGFLSLQFHKINTPVNLAYFVVYLAMDFLIIAILSRPSIKSLFSEDQQMVPTVPPLG